MADERTKDPRVAQLGAVKLVFGLLAVWATGQITVFASDPHDKPNPVLTQPTELRKKLSGRDFGSSTPGRRPSTPGATSRGP
jgi:hypothetical protein